jgi:(heptosyl)LPS beta-1,4-glucosyltransferase
METVSVVFNTFNVARDLPRAIASVKSLAEEIVVADMGSTDGTVEAAKKLGAKVFSSEYAAYVEPARNFAISKAKGDWILILDPDEEIPAGLIKKIKEILKDPKADYFRIPRKNIIFGKWIKHSRWWPDYNIRFFKKGFVSWNEVIHSVPLTQGTGVDLPEKEEYAIVHRNYESVDQYLERMARYTTIQAEDLMKNGYVFSWKDIIVKPLNEFLGRFFAGEGFKDGLHGLALGFLQAFSELVVYLKVWQKQGFKENNLERGEIKSEFNKGVRDIKWWLRKKFSFWSKLF